MIILMGVTGRVVLVLFSLIVLYGAYRRNRFIAKRWVVIALLGTTFCAQLAYLAVPPLSDEIKLTALGRHSASSQGQEVILQGYTIDEENVEISAPTEGKWFWVGSQYMWRPASDPRQPGGSTASITLEVPVGWSRSIQLLSDSYCGKVLLSAGENQWEIDTYGEGPTIMSVEIGRSETSALLRNEILHLVAFVLVQFLGIILSIVISSHFSKMSEVNRLNYLCQHGGKLLYGGICLLIFILMVYFADKQSFWSDEVGMISFYSGSFGTMVDNFLNMVIISPPLYDFFAWAWYHIAPYGQRWLLLVSILPSVLSIYVVGLIGERLRGRFCGTIAVILIGFSSTVWMNQANELRSYCFVVLFTALSFYLYLCRNNNPNPWKFHILLGISMTCLAMSHYFGMLAVVGFFFPDVFLYIKRKLPLKAIVAYLISGGVSLSWLILIYVKTLSHTSTQSIAGWYPVPGIEHIKGLLGFLIGDSPIAWAFLILSFAIAPIAFTVKGGEETVYKPFDYGFLGTVILFPITVIFLYGRYINQSSTMWENRYFIFLVVFIVILMALALNDFLKIILAQNPERRRVEGTAGVLLFLYMATTCIQLQSSLWSYYPYREGGEYLNTQANDIYNKDTVVICTLSQPFTEAWEEYFITQQGKRDRVNEIFSQYTITEEQLQNYHRVYVNTSLVGVAPWLNEVLERDYILVEDRPDLHLRIYNKNTTSVRAE
ncbi:glycosyltransferase family 39 protein [Oscillibacter sp. GMB15532]|uniref:glycosyltransferase family 39 protein n=1 Tax=Oscillibacter sp. GMB15532 TaxID=3230022 RepID=UPI0034DE1E40